jgi:hypothetical protein
MENSSIRYNLFGKKKIKVLNKVANMRGLAASITE